MQRRQRNSLRIFLCDTYFWKPIELPESLTCGLSGAIQIFSDGVMWSQFLVDLNLSRDGPILWTIKRKRQIRKSKQVLEGVAFFPFMSIAIIERLIVPEQKQTDPPPMFLTDTRALCYTLFKKL